MVSLSAMLRRQPSVMIRDRSSKATPVSLTFENGGGRARHADRSAGRPANEQIAAGKADRHGTGHQLATDGGNGSRAGAGAASLRQPRTAFPYDQADVIFANDLRKIDVHALREERIGFDHRSQPPAVHRLQIFAEEDHMRIADIDSSRDGQVFPA